MTVLGPKRLVCPPEQGQIGLEIDTDLPTGGKVTAVGAVAVLVSAFLPWFGAETPVGVSPTTIGIDTTTGIPVLLLALVVGLYLALVGGIVMLVGGLVGYSQSAESAGDPLGG